MLLFYYGVLLIFSTTKPHNYHTTDSIAAFGLRPPPFVLWLGHGFYTKSESNATYNMISDSTANDAMDEELSQVHTSKTIFTPLVPYLAYVLLKNNWL